VKILCLTPVKHIKGVWDVLQQCGDVFYEPDLNYAEVLRAVSVSRPEALFVNPNKMKFKLDEQILSQGVSFVCTASTGTNHIDIEYCSNNDISVLSLTTDMDVIERISSTAEMAFTLMLSLIRNVPSALEGVRSGHWDYEPYIGRQLNYLAAGIVGYGRLGKMFAHYCQSFGMKVAVFDPYVSVSGPYIKAGTLKGLISISDVVSLHVHLNDETYHMINANTLGCLKESGAYLVNTSRGGVVNEEDIVKHLESNKLLGYATDVVSGELNGAVVSPILSALDRLNIIVTPHIAGMTKEGQEIAYTAAAKKLLGCSIR
jgi:phosphoglycerate dehydrogenase-like enzyme